MRLTALGTRKIVHVDMDAFYASVEQRDDANLRGRPVVVAWKVRRSVVCAASYEARRFGVRSAMPAVTAMALSAGGVFAAALRSLQGGVAGSARAIFLRYTDVVEPLSLDEAYLDVKESKTGLPTATLVAKTIRQQIRAERNPDGFPPVSPQQSWPRSRPTDASPTACSSCSHTRRKTFLPTYL